MKNLKEKIRTGDVVHGCWINLSSTVSAEIVGQAGFDWLLLDLEHGAGDVNTSSKDRSSMATKSTAHT
jgi:4-hydroxy-2-oxoheptanedioate aldolase